MGKKELMATIHREIPILLHTRQRATTRGMISQAAAMSSAEVSRPRERRTNALASAVLLYDWDRQRPAAGNAKQLRAVEDEPGLMHVHRVDNDASRIACLSGASTALRGSRRGTGCGHRSERQFTDSVSRPVTSPQQRAAEQKTGVGGPSEVGERELLHRDAESEKCAARRASLGRRRRQVARLTRHAQLRPL